MSGVEWFDVQREHACADRDCWQLYKSDCATMDDALEAAAKLAEQHDGSRFRIVRHTVVATTDELDAGGST